MRSPHEKASLGSIRSKVPTPGTRMLLAPLTARPGGSHLTLIITASV